MDEVTAVMSVVAFATRLAESAMVAVMLRVVFGLTISSFMGFAGPVSGFGAGSWQ